MAVRVRGRRVAQALVGRARGERERARRHRGRRRGTPRGDRGRRGHEGGRGQLGAVLQGHDRTRAEWCAPGGGRPVRRSGGHRRLDAAEGEVPAVHGALHAQRALQDAAKPPRVGVRRPEGRLRPGIARGRPGQGRDRRRGDGIQKTQVGGQLPARGDRRDDDLPAGRVPVEP